MPTKLSPGLVLLNFGKWKRLSREELISACYFVGQVSVLTPSLPLSWGHCRALLLPGKGASSAPGCGPAVVQHHTSAHHQRTACS